MTCGEYLVIPTDQQPVTQDILEQIRRIVERRVNATGVAEPSVQSRGTDRIVVQLRGIADVSAVEEIRGVIETTGRLDFVAVRPADGPLIQDGRPLPEGMDATPILGVDQISAARPGTSRTGEPAVVIELTEAGVRILADHAWSQPDERVAVVLDGLVVTAPYLRDLVADGSVRIGGLTTIDAVNRLVTILHFGPLPLEIRKVRFWPCDS